MDDKQFTALMADVSKYAAEDSATPLGTLAKAVIELNRRLEEAKALAQKQAYLN